MEIRRIASHTRYSALISAFRTDSSGAWFVSRFEYSAQLLAAAGVLEGRECSAYPACAPEVRLAGGTYIDIPVTDGHVQGNLATAPAWPAHPNWLAGFLGLLGTKITL